MVGVQAADGKVTLGGGPSRKGLRGHWGSSGRVLGVEGEPLGPPLLVLRHDHIQPAHF